MFGRKTDSNQKEIVNALRTLGCCVFVIEEPFDLLIDYRGVWMIMEVKNPETHARQKGGSKMTGKQDKILAIISAPVLVAESAEEAIECVTQSYVVK